MAPLHRPESCACRPRGHAIDHPWSSHGATLARSDLFPRVAHPEWLETDAGLQHFGPTRRRAVARYAAFVRAGKGLPSVWKNLRGRVFLGSDKFIERMTTTFDADGAQLRNVPRLQRRRPPRPPAELTSATCHSTRAERDAAMAVAYASGERTLRPIAADFGGRETTGSRAPRRQAASAGGSQAVAE